VKADWRQYVLYATVVGMEGCWLYALMVLLNERGADGRLSIAGLLLLYPLAFGFNVLLRQLRWPKICLLSLSWVVWLLCMLLVVKIQLFSTVAWLNPAWLMALPQAITRVVYTFEPELLILVSSAVMWWLGRRLAYLRINFAASVSEFQFGLAILLITFFITSQLELNIADSVPIALTFFPFALLGMSVAHSQESTSWLSGLYQGHWSVLLLVSISLILVLGLLISALVTPDLIKLFVAVLKWVWVLIVKAMEFLASIFPESGTVELPPDTPMLQPEDTEAFKMWTIPQPLRSGLRLTWTILVGGLMLLALWRVSSQIFSWLRRKLPGAGRVEVESLSGAFRADLLNLLKRIFSKLLSLKWLIRRQRKPEPHEIAPVRQIYRQLLQWASKRGWPRLAYQTPYEYLSTLEELLPASRDSLHFITQHYVSARYGQSLPSDEEIHRLRQSWHQLRQNRIQRPDRETVT